MSEAYEAYLERAARELPGVEAGGYGKFQGRLIKRMDEAEFAGRWQQYQATRQAYDQILESGDTVNDAVVQMLQEHASALLLEE